MSRRDSAGQSCKTDTAQPIAAPIHSRPIAAYAIQEAVTENDLKIVGDAVGKSGLNLRRLSPVAAENGNRAARMYPSIRTA
jgi:hypothetical protein